MGELGYLDTPDYELGMLRAQALRCVRVVIDIGMHLELSIPEGAASGGFHPGERWTPALGLEFIEQRSHFPADFVASEVDRYLGLPGQAISYKVGERAWLEAREAARRSPRRRLRPQGVPRARLRAGADGPRADAPRAGRRLGAPPRTRARSRV